MLEHAPGRHPAPTEHQTPGAPAGAAGQGPRFPYLGPGVSPSDAEGPPRASSSLPPGRGTRCRWDLQGAWDSRGQQVDPTPRSYTAHMVFHQYGNYLMVEQTDDGLNYYGICSGDRVELDAYSADQYVG